MLGGAFSWHALGAVIPLEGKVSANRYLMVLSDYLHPMLQNFFPAGRGLFQDGNALIHRPCVVAQWFDEHESDIIHLSWPSQSPDLN